jgi:hypothetical protein
MHSKSASRLSSLFYCLSIFLSAFLSVFSFCDVPLSLLPQVVDKFLSYLSEESVMLPDDDIIDSQFVKDLLVKAATAG